jgi:protein-S-isoprenylcysteine O-methyltransferase Ste14
MTNKEKIVAAIEIVATVGQIILAFVLYNPQGNIPIINAGWVVLWISAIFGCLPIYTFRKKGEVKGRSYMMTTKVVDSGVYGIVRHPQYLAGVLISLAIPLISQHWLIAVLGLIAAPLYYLNTYDEERKDIEKFGDAYKQYMERVPRMNFILGIIRAIRRKCG